MRSLNQLKQMTLFHFRLMMRNKIAFFFNLVMPLLFLLVFGAMYGGSGSRSVSTIGLADQDGGPTAQAIGRALDRSGLFQVRAGIEAELLAQLDQSDLQAVLVLPKGLSGQVPAEVVLHWDPTSGASATARSGLEFLLTHFDGSGRAAAPALSVRLEQSASLTRLGVMDFMMPGMLTYMLLNAGVVAVAISLAYQRRNGTMRHMFSAPLSVGVWLAGRVLSNLLLALLQIILVWIVGFGLFKVQLPSNLVGTAVILLFSTLAGLAIGLVIGALARSGDTAQPIALIVSMALTFLGNAMMPLDGAPAIVQRLMGLMPSYYMTHALQQVMMKGQSVLTVWFDLAVLAVTAVAGLSLAAWRLRKTFTVAA